MPDLPTIPDPEPILVATLPPAIADLLAPYTTARTVHLVHSVRQHYRAEHGKQMDIAVSETLLPRTIAAPEFFGRSPGGRWPTFFFARPYDDHSLLVVQVKALPTELWVSTVYRDERRRFLHRAKIKRGLLYQQTLEPQENTDGESAG